MRRPIWLWLLVGMLVAGLLILPAAPSHAWRRGGAVFVGVGPGFWWGPPYPPTEVIVEQPSTYIQKETDPPASAYWYYCLSAQEYYPQVQSCPETWVKVPPRAP